MNKRPEVIGKFSPAISSVTDEEEAEVMSFGSTFLEENSLTGMRGRGEGDHSKINLPCSE